MILDTSPTLQYKTTETSEVAEHMLLLNHSGTASAMQCTVASKAWDGPQNLDMNMTSE